MKTVRALARTVAGLVLFVGLPTAHAAGWEDDFNDGSITDDDPVTWITNAGDFFPGDYDASSGDLVMTPPDDAFEGSQMAGFVPTPFTDTYLRTQGIVSPDPNNPDNVGGNLVLLARVDLDSFSGYLLYFDVSGNLNIQELAGGGTQDIGTTFDAPFNAGTEVIIEFHAVGDLLSGYAWAADDPLGRPAEPQVTATHSAYTSGLPGLAFAEDDDGTFGTFRYMIAQDTPIIDGIQGDFDGDLDVDGNDFLIWQRNLTASGGGTLATGDANGDGNVDGADLAIWQQNFGASPGGVTGVPEPGSLTLGALAACVFASVRRRRK